MTKQDIFKKELKELMIKHKAILVVTDVDGDGSLELSFDIENNSTGNFFKHTPQTIEYEAEYTPDNII